jgi:hypothetical protein
VPCPGIQAVGNAEPTKEEEPYLENDLTLADGASGNRTVGLIDGVDVTIVPVVNGLGLPGQEWAGEDHGNEPLSACPLALGRRHNRLG